MLLKSSVLMSQTKSFVLKRKSIGYRSWQRENFVASDIPAIINYTRDTYILSDGELAIVTRDNVSVFDREGNAIDKEVFHVSWNAEAAEKGGYEHFMLKEIHDQPKAVRDTFGTHISEDGKTVHFEELNWTADDVAAFNKISSLHAVQHTMQVL